VAAARTLSEFKDRLNQEIDSGPAGTYLLCHYRYGQTLMQDAGVPEMKLKEEIYLCIRFCSAAATLK
jgi:hypothetical protein